MSTATAEAPVIKPGVSNTVLFVLEPFSQNGKDYNVFDIIGAEAYGLWDTEVLDGTLQRRLENKFVKWCSRGSVKLEKDKILRERAQRKGNTVTRAPSE